MAGSEQSSFVWEHQSHWRFFHSHPGRHKRNVAPPSVSGSKERTLGLVVSWTNHTALRPQVNFPDFPFQRIQIYEESLLSPENWAEDRHLFWHVVVLNLKLGPVSVSVCSQILI